MRSDGSATATSRPPPRVLRGALSAIPHDVFVGDWLAGGRGWAGALEGRVLRTTGYPILALEGRSWDEILAATSPRFRKHVRQSPNRLKRRHDVRFRARTWTRSRATSTPCSVSTAPASASTRAATSAASTSRSSAISQISRSTGLAPAASARARRRSRRRGIRLPLPGGLLRVSGCSQSGLAARVGRLRPRGRNHPAVAGGRRRRVPVPRRRRGVQVPLSGAGSAPRDHSRGPNGERPCGVRRTRDRVADAGRRKVVAARRLRLTGGEAGLVRGEAVVLRDRAAAVVVSRFGELHERVSSAARPVSADDVVGRPLEDDRRPSAADEHVSDDAVAVTAESTKIPVFASTIRLSAKVLAAEPAPSCRHSTLIPVRASTIRLRAIRESLVACSR